MKALRLILLLGLALFLAYAKYASLSSSNETTTQPVVGQSSASPASEAGVPEKAFRVLQIVRTTGHAPEGYVGGRVFQNREGRLPSDGDYREFDVDPHNGGRNAERIIVEWDTKKAWYTGDHYQTFVPLP